MQHINSKNSINYCRQKDKNDNWQKQSYLATKKLSHQDKLEEFKFTGAVHLKPGGTTVLLTLLLLSTICVEGVGAVPTKTGAKECDLKNSAINNPSSTPSASTCTTSSKVGDNVLPILTMAQLLDSKLKIDSAIPERFHKDLQCEKIKEKIKRTVKSFPMSEGPVRRVLEHPESRGMVCTTQEQINRRSRDPEIVAFFVPEERGIYFTNSEDLDSRLISHEFTHADYFFRHTTAPYETNTSTYDPVLPFYPPTEENMKLYKKALDEGDKRVNDFKKLKQKRNRGENLSAEESALFNKYEKASKGTMRNFVMYSSDPYKQFVDKGWQRGKETSIPLYGTDVKVKILGMRQLADTAVLTLQCINSSDAVCMTADDVHERMQQATYRNGPEKSRLLERDAYTFEHLSENAKKEFYPEAYEMRTRDLK